MTDSHKRLLLSSFLSSLGVSCLIWIAACATVSEQTSWIQVGKTTKAEVVARYGEPDLVQRSADGSVATYRPTASKRPSPSLQIPTVQPGPLGTTTTTMKPIEPGLGAEDATTGRHEWIRKEIRIRYDAQGIVQEVLE